MKTPNRRRRGTPPSAQNGLRGLYFGVWCYRRATIGASPTTFYTVSEGEFCELRPNGVLRSSALLNGGGFFTAPAYEGVQTSLCTYGSVYPNCQRLKLGLRRLYPLPP